MAEKTIPRRGRMRPRRRIPVILLVVVAAACAGAPIPEYPREDLEHYPISRVEGGVGVAIQPLTDRREVEKYFGLNLLDRDILPVFVLIENRTDGQTFVFDARRLGLRAEEDHRPGVDGDLEDDRSWRLAAATGGVLLSLPIMIVASKMVWSQAEREQNLATKELRSQTLVPGGATSGFAYFDVGSVDSSPSWTLHVELMETRTRSGRSIDLRFDWMRGDRR